MIESNGAGFTVKCNQCEKEFGLVFDKEWANLSIEWVGQEKNYQFPQAVLTCPYCKQTLKVD